jgi:exonuclease III
VEAGPAFNNQPTKPGAGVEGTTILIAPKWQNALIASGSLYRGRILWINFSGIPGGDIGLINIYAPNDQMEHKIIWQNLHGELLANYRWIIAGDFNFVETREDKSSHCSCIISDTERLAWDGLKQTLDVADHFYRDRGLKYNWDNLRKNDQRILARLDRIYLFNITPNSPARTIETYTIKGDCTISDHLLVSYIFHLGHTPRC